MGVRKIESIKSVHELDLNTRSARVVADHLYSASTIITAARNGSLRKLDGIGQAMEQDILAAVDKAGFILRESKTSAGMRDLLTKAFKFRPVSREERETEYEARTEFTEEQKEALFKLLNLILTEQEINVLNRRFGLSGNEPLSLGQIAAERYVSRERVRQVEASALRKTRHPARRKTLKGIFPNWSGFPDDTPDEDVAYDGPLEEMPVEELHHISVRAFYCLERASIRTVGQLLERSYDEVRQIRNMTGRSADGIVKSLAEIGLKLKKKA